jgi:hypothetical protein
MGTLSIFGYQEVPFSRKVFSEISIANCISTSVVVEVDEHRSPLTFPFLDAIVPPLQIIIRVGAAVEVVGVGAGPWRRTWTMGARYRQDTRKVRPTKRAQSTAERAFQKRKYLCRVPTIVSEFDSYFDPWGNLL